MMDAERLIPLQLDFSTSDKCFVWCCNFHPKWHGRAERRGASVAPFGDAIVGLVTGPARPTADLATVDPVMVIVGLIAVSGAE